MGSHDRSRGWLPNVVTGRANALPQNTPAAVGECHAQILEVLENRTQGVEVLDIEDEIEPPEVDVEAANGKLLPTNGKSDITGDPFAGHTVPVSHQHLHGRMGRGGEA